METEDNSFDLAIRAHDDAVAATGLDIWIGAEPTFTNRLSESPEWLSEALGDTKQSYACRIIERLRADSPGSIVLRTLGRQYPGEDKPRWSLGLYQRRDGQMLADELPFDPLSTASSCATEQCEQFWQALGKALDTDGWRASRFQTNGDIGQRILFRCDGQPVTADPQQDDRLNRPALQSQAIPDSGAVDELAAEDLYLVAIGFTHSGPDNSMQPCIELPALPDVETFMTFIRRVAQAAQQSGLSELVWCGFPPPVDDSVAWMTVTPDPAVVEVNEAPARSSSEFLAMSRQLFTVVQAVGLAPYRLHYNGEINESGGGGQFTLGGPSPARSPFFVAPRLMSRLVCYLNQHPSLSYWFAPRYVGSFSQSPRTDENVLESFSELHVALQQLAATAEPEAEFIWRSLSPFLVDTSGNAHRSEINIEKLWNPYLPGRGELGLVEFRAFRMAQSAETAAAIAALLRALAAMLGQHEMHDELIEWGSELHDRFALPYYLRQDLQTVCNDLEAAGLGLGKPITEHLFADGWRHLGHAELAGCRLDVELAIEFWPLLGDAARHEGGSRLVDASTSRLQLTLRPTNSQMINPDDWQLLVGNYRLALRLEQDSSGTLLIMGLRYRAFAPWIGLHPGIKAQTPIVLTLLSNDSEQGLRITLHDWQPDSLPYDGLPDSLDEAHRRIRERFVIETISSSQITGAIAPPAKALTDYCLDLRRT